MTDQPRPRTYSLGNSLTSISSLTTFPPSPAFKTHPTRSAEVVGSVNKPTDVRVDPLNLSTTAESPIEGSTLLGSVPSPRPSHSHLVASAPSRPRPRLARPHSSPGDARTRIPSPLNPARQLQRPALQRGGAFCLEPGSVPQPRPNRLFTSVLGLPVTDRTPTDPKLPPPPKLTRCPPRLTHAHKSSAPRKISPPRTGGSGSARRIPMSTDGQTSDLPDSASPPEPLARAPNSFSTFVATVTSLKRDSLISTIDLGSLRVSTDDKNGLIAAEASDVSDRT